ncbi:MAG: phospholipid carrier-dependent glycosyltransferase, partial [Candidatus Aminicenantes bacterium]
MNMKQHWPIAALVLAALVINTYLIIKHPVRKTWGDEAIYIELAHQEVSFLAKLKRLVPGNMFFEWRPPFAYGLYGLFASKSITQAYHQKNTSINPNLKWNDDFSIFFNRVSFFNLVLLIIIGVNIYILCLWLNSRKACAIAASAMIFFNPRLLFYVQSIWPELLHLALLTSALLLLILYYRREKLLFLIISGILFGFCSLTKGITGLYLFSLLPVFFYFLYHRSGKNVKSSLKLVAIFFCCYLGVILPQKLSNYFNHHVFSIALNKWVNIECGIIPAHEAGGALYERYYSASPDLVTREKLSKKRVFDYLKRTSMVKVFAKQLGQFVSMQLNDSFLYKGFL